MKKLFLLAALFSIFISGSVFGQMKLSIPDNLPHQDEVYLSSGNDNISFTNKELQSQLNLQMPETAVKVQSDYLRAARMLAALQFLLALPMGDFGESYSTGFGANFTFAYLIAAQIYLTANIGYLKWGLEHDLPDGVEQSFSTIPFLIGIRYLFSTGSLMPYVMAQFGLHFLSYTYKYSFGNFNVDDSQTETKFGAGFGAGLFYALSAAMMIDFSLRYWLITQEHNSANNIVFLLGLAYALNGGM